MDSEFHSISRHIQDRTWEMVCFGDDDLDVARSIMSGSGRVIPRKACIEAHTAAEKYLKAFLVLHKQKYRRLGHSLLAACMACEFLDPAFAQIRVHLKFLDKYNGEVDYPPPKPFSLVPRQDLAFEAIDRAAKIRAFVIEMLQKHGFQIPEV